MERYLILLNFFQVQTPSSGSKENGVEECTIMTRNTFDREPPKPERSYEQTV
jgi:hypothetical protein